MVVSGAAVENDKKTGGYLRSLEQSLGGFSGLGVGLSALSLGIGGIIVYKCVSDHLATSDSSLVVGVGL